MGRFPELTPVRSQAIELWLTTLEAGDITLPLEWTPASTVGWPLRRRVVGRFGVRGPRSGDLLAVRDQMAR